MPSRAGSLQPAFLVFRTHLRVKSVSMGFLSTNGTKGEMGVL